jgi:hypothetical protein
LIYAQVVVGIIMTNLRLKTGLAFHTKEQLVWPATKDAFDFMPSPYVAQKLSMDSIEGTPLKVPTPLSISLCLRVFLVILIACKRLASTSFSVMHTDKQKWLVGTDTD